MTRVYKWVQIASIFISFSCNSQCICNTYSLPSSFDAFENSYKIHAYKNLEAIANVLNKGRTENNVVSIHVEFFNSH